MMGSTFIPKDTNTGVDLLDIVIPATEAGIQVDLYVQHKDKNRRPCMDSYKDVDMSTISEMLGQINISCYTVDSMDYKRAANRIVIRMSQQCSDEAVAYREAGK